MSLTYKQTIFVDSYIDAIDAGFKPRIAFKMAKEAAGYSENTYKRDIINDEITTEILAHANRHMVMKIPEALNMFDSLLDDPTQDGAAIKLNALNSFFDRSGIIKKESKEVTIKSPTGIVFLPAKGDLDPV